MYACNLTHAHACYPKPPYHQPLRFTRVRLQLHVRVHVYVYACMRVCVCVRACVVGWGGGASQA